MKEKITIILLVFVNISIAQKDNSNIKSYIKIIDTINLKEFNYYRIIQKDNIKNDEKNGWEINLQSNEVPKTNRIIENINKDYYSPVFFSIDRLNNKLILNKYDFLDICAFFDINFSNEQELVIKDEIIECSKKYNIYNRNIKNIKIIEIEISIGLYNKYTKCMNLIGDFDEVVNAYFLII